MIKKGLKRIYGVKNNMFFKADVDFIYNYCID